MSKGPKGRIGILTGGGDIPGLNQAIRGVTMRALREGFDVVGIRRGWAGLVDLDRDTTEEPAAETCSPLLHPAHRGPRRGQRATRAAPSCTPRAPSRAPCRSRTCRRTSRASTRRRRTTSPTRSSPTCSSSASTTSCPMGGDDTLSYGVELGRRGFPVVAVPKTMDNDVPGTDYCMGFSTCVSRTIEMAHQVTSSAASHERIVVLEVFGRYAGFTALLPTLAGAADRCVIPEYKFDMEHLAELLVHDRNSAPRPVLRLHRQRGRHARGRRHGVPGRREGPVRPRQAGRHRPEREQQDQGARAEVQRRPEDRHDQHEPRLPGAQRRAGRRGRHRADRVRQPGRGLHPQG